MLLVEVHESETCPTPIVHGFPVYADARTSSPATPHAARIVSHPAHGPAKTLKQQTVHTDTRGGSKTDHDSISHESHCADSVAAEAPVSSSIQGVRASASLELPRRLLHTRVTSMAVCPLAQGVLFTYITNPPSWLRHGDEAAVAHTHTTTACAEAATVGLGFSSFHDMDTFTPVHLCEEGGTGTHGDDDACAASSLDASVPRRAREKDEHVWCAAEPDVWVGEWRVQRIVGVTDRDAVWLFDRRHGHALRLVWQPPPPTSRAAADSADSESMSVGAYAVPSRHACAGRWVVGARHEAPPWPGSHRHSRVRRVLDMSDAGTLALLTSHGTLLLLTPTAPRPHYSSTVWSTHRSAASAGGGVAHTRRRDSHGGSGAAGGGRVAGARAVVWLHQCMCAETWRLHARHAASSMVALVAAVHDGAAAGAGVDSIVVYDTQSRHVAYQFTLRNSGCVHTTMSVDGEEVGEMALCRVRGVVPLVITNSLVTDEECSSSATSAAAETSAATGSTSAPITHVHANSVEGVAGRTEEHAILVWSRCELNVISWSREEWSHCTLLSLLPCPPPVYTAASSSTPAAKGEPVDDAAAGVNRGLPSSVRSLLLLAVCAASPPDVVGAESSLDCPVAFVLIADGTVYGVWRHGITTRRTKDAITADADLSDDHLQHYVNMECGYRVQCVAYVLNTRLLSITEVYGHTMHYVNNGCDEVKEVRGVLYVYGIEKANGERLSEAVVLMS